MDQFFLSRRCVLCSSLTNEELVCKSCQANPQLSHLKVFRKKKEVDKQLLHMKEVCAHCTGCVVFPHWGDLHDSGFDCESLDCDVYYEKLKLKERQLYLQSSMQ